MQLILTIENGPQSEISGTTWCCGTEGGTLGRNPNCDLVLPDPERFTSSIHALIEFDRDGFTLTDRSINGTYHNSPKTLIGKNRSVALGRNDRIYIGDFILHVDVQEVDPDASDRPPASTTSPLDRSDVEFDGEADIGSDFINDDGGFGDVNDDLNRHSGLDSNGGEIVPNSSGSRAAGNSRPWDNSEFSVPWNGAEPDPEDNGKSDRDKDDDRSFSQSPEREYFAAPSSSPGGGEAIPEDWDDFLTGFQDLSKKDKPGAAADTAANSAPHPDPDRRAHGQQKASERNSLPFADAEPDPEEQFDPPAAPTPSPARLAENHHEISSAKDSVSAQEPEHNADQMARSSPRARSHDSTLDPKSNTAESSSAHGWESAPEAQLHEILQVATEGLMGLLHGRAEIKNEFRIAQTRFVQTENNPLKFSPDADEALKRILADEESPGFLTGVRAFEDAFDDIQAHQLAILSAVQQAIESAVAQFDPAQIKKKLERISPMSSRMPGLKAAKCWNLYSLHYDDVAAKMRDDAWQLFLTEFAEAYEEACRAVTKNKRNDES